LITGENTLGCTPRLRRNINVKRVAMIKHFCPIALTSLLALCAVGGIIAVKTAAFLSHFTH
jgi:hypothetical protein